MPRKEIKASLLELKEKLKDLIESGKSPELEEMKQKLDTVLDDIDDWTDDSLKEVVSGVKESIAEMEGSHPSITSTLNQLMNMLSNLGI